MKRIKISFLFVIAALFFNSIAFSNTSFLKQLAQAKETPGDQVGLVIDPVRTINNIFAQVINVNKLYPYKDSNKRMTAYDVLNTDNSGISLAIDPVCDAPYKCIKKWKDLKTGEDVEKAYGVGLKGITEKEIKNLYRINQENRKEQKKLDFICRKSFW